MAYINSDEQINVYAQLTGIGRQQLAYGQLTYNQFAVGDSEVDYAAISRGVDPQILRLLRPTDAFPDLRYPVRPVATSQVFRAPLPTQSALEVEVHNQAPERGFFTRTSGAPDSFSFDETLLQGGTAFVVGEVTGDTRILPISGSGFNDGDYVIVRPRLTDGDIEDLSVPIPARVYKITDANASGGAQVDRNISLLSVGGDAYIIPGPVNSYDQPSTVPYWNPYTLQVNPTANLEAPSIWNLNIVYNDNVAGDARGDYPSQVIAGLRPWLDTYPSWQPVGIIHYTNHAVGNNYGEGFYSNSFAIDLPLVLYHGVEDQVAGLRLDSGTTKRVLAATSTDPNPAFSLVYYDLVAPDTKVVGKILVDLGIALIEDPEILAALTYKSNRNWTLPTPRNFTATNTTGVKDFWFTYRLLGYDNVGASTSISLHCTNYQKIENVDLVTGISFNFTAKDWQFLCDGEAGSLPDGQGFKASDLQILYQYTNSGLPPDPLAWKAVALLAAEGGDDQLLRSQLTSSFLTVTSTELTTGTLYTTAYLEADDLDGEDAPLNFGEEVFLIGNITTQVKASVYRSRFVAVLGPGQYTTSQNPSWSPEQPVYVTEIGLYDNQNNLVAIGKFTIPRSKRSTDSIVVDIILDF